MRAEYVAVMGTASESRGVVVRTEPRVPEEAREVMSAFGSECDFTAGAMCEQVLFRYFDCTPVRMPMRE